MLARVLAPLVVAALLTTPVPAVAETRAPTGAPYDSSPGQGAAIWLVQGLVDDLVDNGGSPSYGVSIDLVLGMDAVGRARFAAQIAKTTAAVARGVDDYVGAPAAGVDITYAGSTAKTIVLAQTAGADPRDFGGRDLVAKLEGRVATGPAAGRISDQSPTGDFSNTIGQAFAARGLAAAGSTKADAVTSYLLKQQCADGFFTLTLSQLGTTCDANPRAAGSTDVTSYAILALLPRATGADADPVLADAVTRAVAWLATKQEASGAVSDPPAYGPNANTTGLAAWALGEASDVGFGRRVVAERASIWLRAHQLVNAGRCAVYAGVDEGAIAYDDAALGSVEPAKDGTPTPIDDDTRGQFVYATAQSFPGLQWAPDGVRSPITAPAGFVRTGSTHRLRIPSSPGDAVCLDDGGTRTAVRVGAAGVVVGSVTASARPGTRTVVVSDGDQRLATVRLRALGRTRFEVTARRTAAVGATQRVRITGLADGERAVLTVGGRRLASVVGTGRPVRAEFEVTGRPGTRTVTVTGAFADLRRGSVTYRVVG